jgi:hypothetical protein
MRKLVFLGTAGVAAALAVPAHAQDRKRVEISPYIEVGQVLTADLQSGDVLTYSSAAVGVDASVQTRRVQVQLSYKYEHRFEYDKQVGDSDVHSGLARVQAAILPGLTVEAGAIATRARSDIRGDAPGNLAGNVRNTSQVYSAYAGPTVATRVGPANVTAGYRFGYTKVESPGVTGVPAGQPVLDSYDSSTSHLATASVGVKAGDVLPVGLTVSGAWERENSSQLNQQFDSKNVRADAVLPVTGSVAVVGGVGYEKIETSQKDALLDGTGQPVRDANGRFVTDPNSPQRLSYQLESIFWDVGVIWRPSPRTTLEARVGRRYDSWSFTGSLSYQLSPGSGLQIGVYDSIESFGRQLNDSLASLPTSFNTGNDPFGDQYNGCVFGTSGAATGGCLNGALQSIATANYRTRGVDAVFAMNAGRSRFGAGLGYSNRRFLAPDASPGFTVNGVTDQSYYAQLFAATQLDNNMGLNGNVYANYYQSGIAGAPSIFGAGANGSVYRNFGPVNASASLGIYSFEQEGAGSDVSAQALVGLRYGF